MKKARIFTSEIVCLVAWLILCKCSAILLNVFKSGDLLLFRASIPDELIFLMIFVLSIIIFVRVYNLYTYTPEEMKIRKRHSAIASIISILSVIFCLVILVLWMNGYQLSVISDFYDASNFTFIFLFWIVLFLNSYIYTKFGFLIKPK